MAYGITSSSQLIDVAAISNGCTAIEVAAESFETCAKKVESASSICNKNALSVDETTMQPQLTADAEYIRSIKSAIYDFTSSIRNVASQIYAAQQAELAEYQARLEAEAKEEAAKNNGSTS